MNERSEVLWNQLSQSKAFRDAFLEAQLKQSIPVQIRALLRYHGKTQAEVADAGQITQGVVSRACDPEYGNLTLTTIANVAKGFDVGFIGMFVPFGEMADWITGFSDAAFRVPSFEQETLARRRSNVSSPRLKLVSSNDVPQPAFTFAEPPHLIDPQVSTVSGEDAQLDDSTTSELVEITA